MPKDINKLDFTKVDSASTPRYIAVELNDGQVVQVWGGVSWDYPALSQGGIQVNNAHNKQLFFRAAGEYRGAWAVYQ